ncbi:MAG: NfeD family protein [Acidobacteria bacterium]|nr:NfeD family protein [Acidobacteriota bacterium]
MSPTVYLLCFGIGFVFLLASFILGELADLVHVDGGGHGPGPLSTSVVATFAMGFGMGGYGAISLLKWAKGPSVLVAMMAGLAFAGATWGVLRFLYHSGEGSSEFRLEDLIGAEAEITVPIPVGGRGEIAFIAAKARQIATALSADGGGIAKNRTVKIVRVSGDTMIVEEIKKLE